MARKPKIEKGDTVKTAISGDMLVTKYLGSNRWLCQGKTSTTEEYADALTIVKKGPSSAAV